MLLACLQVSTRNNPSIHHQKLYKKSTIQRLSGLRSASRYDLVIPATKNKFEERSFAAVGGHSAWNALPEEVRADESIKIFKCKLKTRLFGLSYDT